MLEIAYVDPQSYHNLSIYDKGMLCQMDSSKIVLFGCDKWDCDPPNALLKKWFKYNKKKNKISKGLSYIFSIVRIANYIKKRKIKIIHIQWVRIFPIDYYFLLWLRYNKIKVVYTAHNILPHNSGNKYKRAFNNYYNKVDYICVHSERTKQELTEQFNIPIHKISVIPHGIINYNNNDENIQIRSEELKTLHNIKSSDIIFSSLGIQSFYKGIDIIIDVWASTPQLFNNGNIKLMLVGKNKDIDYSKVINIDNVIIINESVSNLDFQSYLNISNIILLPYRKISQSGVLFSAINSNKPVIISDIGGLTDPLKIGNIGWNIGSPNPINLKKKLLDIINNPVEYNNMNESEEEFIKIKDYYSWTRISKCLKSFYDSILNR